MAGPKKAPAGGYLSKREQQIMELAYQRERITASDLEESLPGNPTNSTVRTLLRILENKGELRHVEEDGKYVYLPVKSRRATARTALLGIAKTFFSGSLADVAVALLSDEGRKLSDDELNRLQQAIDQARSK